VEAVSDLLERETALLSQFHHLALHGREIVHGAAHRGAELVLQQWGIGGSGQDGLAAMRNR